MANIYGRNFCCHECAIVVNNGDVSHIEYYGAEYFAEWGSGIPTDRMVIVSVDPATNESVEFNCDYCDRNVLSRKYKMEWV